MEELTQPGVWVVHQKIVDLILGQVASLFLVVAYMWSNWSILISLKSINLSQGLLLGTISTNEKSWGLKNMEWLYKAWGRGHNVKWEFSKCYYSHLWPLWDFISPFVKWQCDMYITYWWEYSCRKYMKAPIIALLAIHGYHYLFTYNSWY